MAQKANTSNQWDNQIKIKIKEYEDSEQINVDVAPPIENVPKEPEKKGIDFFFDRRRERKTDKPVDLKGSVKPSGPSQLPVPVKAPLKQGTLLMPLKKDVELVKAVIDVERYASKKNIEHYKKKMFKEQKGVPKMGINIKSNSAAMKEQMQIIEQANKPSWIIEK